VPPVENQTTSLTATGPAWAGPAAFTTTHWSVVLQAQGESPAAQEALENLCRTYWRPIYSFVRREGVRPEEAKDITQGFFALILERKDFHSVRQEKGRLRSFLLASLKHFMANERRDAAAIKRGGGRTLISLDGIAEDVQVCSVGMLRGLYLWTIDGYTRIGGNLLPTSVMQGLQFNGDGTTYNAFGTVNIGGTILIDATGGVGTYTVAPDCTGTLSITGAPTFNLYIGPGGKQLWTINTNVGPGDGTSLGLGTATRVPQ
jgi:hypothetical protein